MIKNARFFSVASKVFWAFIVLLIIMSFLHLDFGLFRTEKVADEIAFIDSATSIDPIDTMRVQSDSIAKIDYVQYKWGWQSFDGKKYLLKFSLQKDKVLKASLNRSSSTNRSEDLYRQLYSFDRNVLVNMIEGYKRIIKTEALNYYTALNMVITSIQSIPYTLVLTSSGIKFKGEWVKCPCETNFGVFKENCKALPDGDGCCNNVDPWGVFSPVEFATRKTGDCDTRSLFAFTILKELGYDVAVMGSDEESHSVLGVKVPGIPGDGVRGSDVVGRQYFLWELTSYGHKLGTNVKGNDWVVSFK